MKILNIPIEPLEERYSVQWDRWSKEEFAAANLDFTTIYGGESLSGKINRGSFLDVIETNSYKTEQLQYIINFLSNYDDKEPLVLFFHDLWFPGLANIAYIRDGLMLKNLYITGCLHAGSYDAYDFLNKQQMTPWAHSLENSMFEIVDQIYVATNYHKELICSKRTVDKDKIHVTGFPLYPDFVPITLTKQNIIVFPHRLDSEKQPELFTTMCREVGRWNWLKSKEYASNKEEYYELLNLSKIAVSFALQETWGIAMQEAVLCGCIPLCPNRLSYPELYEEEFLFDNFEVAKFKILHFMLIPPHGLLLRQQEMILKKGAAAIPNIIQHIKSLTND